MTTFSKLLTLALLAVSAVVISSAHPSSAQSGAVFSQAYDPIKKQPPCCRLTTKPFFTGSAGWTVKPPNAPTIPAAVIGNPNSAWSTVPGSKWIGNVSTAGQSNQPGGTYVYTYHLGCLCGLPDRITSVPASLYLNVYADDDVTVKLNGAVIAQHTGGYGFSNLTHAAQISVDFQQMCDNVLTFEVPNWDGVSTGPHPIGPVTKLPNANGSAARAAQAPQIPLAHPIGPNSPPGSPTGLDVYGSVSGYFADTPEGQHCPPCPQRGKIIDPR
jgi:hypothetical protein